MTLTVFPVQFGILNKCTPIYTFVCLSYRNFILCKSYFVLVDLPGDNNVLVEFPIHRFSECSRIGKDCYIITIDGESTLLRFKDEIGKN